MLRDRLKCDIKNYLLSKEEILKGLNLHKNLYVDFLAQGEYNINYVIGSDEKKYVFRVNTGSQLQLENQIEYEYNALKTLEISSVTPKVYYVDGSKGEIEYGVLIMEFLEGEPLDYNMDLEKAAKIFAKIHSLDIDSMNNKSHFIVEEGIFTERIKEGERLLKDYFNSTLVEKQKKKFFYTFLDWAIKNSYNESFFIKNKWHVINNTEVNSHNFIIGNDKSYLIDWEKPVISDPCQDLTQFLAPTTTLWKADYILSTEEREGFFKTYTLNLDTEDKRIRERVHLYTPYLYLRALSWCAYAWLEYKNPNRAIKNMDTLKKIEQYLEIDFMKGLLKEYF